MSEPAAVRATGFGYRYPQADEPALVDVTLSLPAGSFTLVVGASGSGKSTLLRALSGLVPHFHGGDARGWLEVAGLDVRSSGPAALAAVCGTVLQDPESQVVMNGVRAELSLPLERGASSAAEIARGVEEVALALGIERLLERSVETLSGGELQRVALAAAIARRPQLLVLDEPTSQLDPVAGDELVSLLRRLNEEWGTAVVLAEHRLERSLPAADRVVALAGGRVVHDGAPADFLDWARRTQPALEPPAARLFTLAGLSPPPLSVKHARERFPPCAAPAPAAPLVRGKGRALRLKGVWHELADGPALLRGIDLRAEPGERIALLGRNGAGKTTLLRHIKGLAEPTAGKLSVAGDVALLLQNPGDYLIHERASEETSAAGLAAAGLATHGDAHPRDLSGGERQRLALEVALADRTPAVVCLDEPTRGMDNGWKDALARRLEALAGGGAAVIVATHDIEFAARFAARVVLLGKGEVIADGDARDVLAGGWHFSTDVARVTAGAALTPEQGARLVRPTRLAEAV